MNIVEAIKKIKPFLKEKTLKNYQTSFNVCKKHFNKNMYYKNPEEVLIFYETKYKNILSRKTNLHAQALICKAFKDFENEKKYIKYAKDIENKLKLEKKKLLESNEEKPEKPKENKKEIIIEDFEIIKNKFSDQLKEIQKLAIMSLYSTCFFSDNLYNVTNPPRRLEYRFLKLINGKIPKKNNEFNFLIKKNNKKMHLMFNKYKANAFKIHGIQKLSCNDKLINILDIYLKTHNKLLEKNGLIFPQNLYNNKPQQVYNDFQWSKLIKKYFELNVNKIRKAFVTRAYSSPKLPETIILEKLAYKMGHSLKTALTEYRNTTKKI
jgi:hypothetical protein